MRRRILSEELIRLMIDKDIKNSAYGVYANMETSEGKTKTLIIDLEDDHEFKEFLLWNAVYGMTHPVIYDVGIPGRMRPVKYDMKDCIAALVGIRPQVYRNDDVINLRGFNLKKLNLNQTEDTGIADVIWDYKHSTIMDRSLRVDIDFNVNISDDIIEIVKSKREYAIWQRKK